MEKILKLTGSGLFCEAGGFYIDPSRAVERCVVTHAHSDHARPGCRHYLAAFEGSGLLKLRLGNINLQTLKYGEVLNINGVKLSLHPAGHILGSAQVRIEYKNTVCVVSGDYKLGEDLTCAEFEPVRCSQFITESTFALPVYRWESQSEIFRRINDWWRNNSRNNITSIIYGYSLGKAQRILSGLDGSIGEIFSHNSVERYNECYRNMGIRIPGKELPANIADIKHLNKAIIVAPPSADPFTLTGKTNRYLTSFASGWMQTGRNRKRGNVDKGFILSDHADWNELLDTIAETGAEEIYVTHGFESALVRWLNEQGTKAFTLDDINISGTGRVYY
jgi:putative mRNA 3-end processing factor